MDESWQVVTVVALLFNALLGFGYRLYRLQRGGSRADVNGQALLGVILIALAVALMLGEGWPRWPAFVYGLLFGVVVMPIWVLAVLIPGSPGKLDYTFTAVYWIVLFAIVVSALAI